MMWDDFVSWLYEGLKVEPSKLPIKWMRISGKDGDVIRLDFAPGKPYHVNTTFMDDASLCNRDHALRLANRVGSLLIKSLKLYAGRV